VKHHALSKTIISHIQQQHPVLAAIVQSRVDDFDAWLSDVAAAKSAYDKASDAFWTTLTLARKLAWNNISSAADLIVFVASLSANERAVYDAMVAARQSLATALQGGPTP
jgi:hypothetical protein